MGKPLVLMVAGLLLVAAEFVMAHETLGFKTDWTTASLAWTHDQLERERECRERVGEVGLVLTGIGAFFWVGGNPRPHGN
jgi:hypothetical protein